MTDQLPLFILFVAIAYALISAIGWFWKWLGRRLGFRHWWRIVFIDQSTEGNSTRTTYMSRISGNPKKELLESYVALCATETGVPSTAFVLSCAYIGYMTDDEAIGVRGAGR